MAYRPLALSLLTSVFMASANAATPAHSYVFGSGFADSDVSWTNASLSSTGIDVFWDGQVNISNVVSSPEYSLDFQISLNRTDWQRKVLDFKNLSSESGVYVDFGRLGFADATGTYVTPLSSSPTEISVDSPVRLTFTRTSAGLFSAYVNGTAQFSFDDAANLATFSTTATLFRDDSAICGYCQTGGSLTYLNVYDSALSAREVASLGGSVTPAVPEPETLALVAAGLLTAVSLGRRRQNKA